MSKDDMPKPPRVALVDRKHRTTVYIPHDGAYRAGVWARSVVSSTLGAAIAIYVMAQIGVI